MSEQAVILTREGLQQLEEELEYLRAVKRQEVAERLKEAIALGDLSENSEYDDAKNEQAFTEGRILELEKMVRNAVVIEDGDMAN
ncbi:MAG: transcription elongation factor GreA, partial [Peptococcaceae bacterium]|nr:transcription elongation factor GreA [Peptococcaceae bacterium]